MKDEHFMQLAINEAKKAFEHNQEKMPIGAVIVYRRCRLLQLVIICGKRTQHTLSHAELVAIQTGE